MLSEALVQPVPWGRRTASAVPSLGVQSCGAAPPGEVAELVQEYDKVLRLVGAELTEARRMEKHAVRAPRDTVGVIRQLAWPAPARGDGQRCSC